MHDVSLTKRGALGDRLQQLKSEVAETVTRRFLERHPDWVTKYGERAWEFGVQDARFHVDFLRGAVEAGSVAAFEDYCEWVAGVLRARGIASEFLVENLAQIESVLAGRLLPAELAMVAPILEAGRAACERERVEEKRREAALALTQRLYLQSILIGARAGSVQIVNEALAKGADLFDIYTQVFQESLYELGRLWEAGEISVSVEHRATAITQFVMAGIYSRSSRSRPSNPPRWALVTGVAGELHQIGANMVADVLETAGWNVEFLGTDAPHSGIIEAVVAQKSDLVCISATMLFNVPNVVRLIRDLRQRSPEIRVLIGGAAFRARPELCAEIGADGFAPDLAAAVEEAERVTRSVRPQLL